MRNIYESHYQLHSLCSLASPLRSIKFHLASLGAAGKRNNSDYDKLKKSLETKLLAGLYRNYPATRGKVDFIDVGTPLTNKYYLGRADSYGLEHAKEHYSGALDKMRPLTNIRGLWCTGQDFCTVGIVGALNGGILTAHSILGYGFYDMVVTERNLIEDLMRMEAKEDNKRRNLNHSKEGL